MNITVIGYGNVGGTLADVWSQKGHQVTVGAKDLNDPKLKAFLEAHPKIKAQTTLQSVKDAEVIVIAIPAQFTADLAKELGSLQGKIVIDTTNSVFTKPTPYQTGFEAFQKITGAKMAKCFNSTGAENMKNPIYHTPNGEELRADMFVAGSDPEAKKIAFQLSQDAGFETYDFGGDDKVVLLEEVCRIWIHLAMGQGLGRNMAIKILKK